MRIGHGRSGSLLSHGDSEALAGVVQVADIRDGFPYRYMFLKLSYRPRSLLVEVVTSMSTASEKTKAELAQSLDQITKMVIEPTSPSPESQTSAGTLPPDLIQEQKSEDRRLPTAAYYSG